MTISFMGGNSSPFKKIRSKAEMSFGEGGDHSTDLQDLSNDTQTPANWEYSHQDENELCYLTDGEDLSRVK